MSYMIPMRRNWIKKMLHVDDGDEIVGINTISFKYTFRNDNDKVYFSLIKPYSFSRLYSFIFELENSLRKQEQSFMEANGEIENYIFNKFNKPKNKIAQNLFKFESTDIQYSRDVLCYTNCGLPIDVITIEGKDKEIPKKYILVTSRVHASEVPGSFKMEQFLRSITSPEPFTLALLKYFTVIIVPMLNPDGVTIGNTRTSFEGYDLNRCWDMPDKSSHTPIYYLKKLLKRLTKNDKEIFLFCDLHGHSKLPNSFIYACNRSAEGDFNSWTKMRLLPKLLSKLCPFFSYNSCQYKVEADKQSTGRVVIWKEFNVTSSFTLETSIFGYMQGEQCQVFSEDNLFLLGSVLIRAFYEYSKIMRELGKEMMLSRAYNFLFDQIDRNLQKDEKFPVIEVKKKNSISPAKQEKKHMTQINFMKASDSKEELLKLNNSIAFEQTPQIHVRTNTLTELNQIEKEEDEEEEFINDPINTTEWKDNIEIPKDGKEIIESYSASPAKPRACLRSKLMNFGGELATLRGKPSPKVRCLTREDYKEEGPKEDSCTYDFLMEKKAEEAKTSANLIVKIRDDGKKRKTTAENKMDKISKRNKSHDYCARNNKKERDFIIYKIAPHVDLNMGKFRSDQTFCSKSPIKESITVNDKPNISRDNLQYVILNQLNIYPSLYGGGDCRAIINSPLTKAFDVFNHSSKAPSRFTFKSKLRTPQIYVREHYNNLRKKSEEKGHYLNEEVVKKRVKSMLS